MCSAFLHLSICLEVSPVDPEVSRYFSPFPSPELDLVHRQVMVSTGRSPGTLSRKCLDEQQRWGMKMVSLDFSLFPNFD